MNGKVDDRWQILALLACLCGITAGPGFAATVEQVLASTRNIVLERHEVEIKIDGRLDEPVWATLEHHGEFYVTRPDTMAEPAYDTRVRIFYSSRGLVVGMEADQPPETLLARLSGRDVFLDARDSLGLTLDTSGTGRYGFYFQVHLGGTISDGTVLPERQFSREWDGPWRGASHVHETGWSAELLIPWGTISMPSAKEARRMGISFSRRVGHLQEQWHWPALPFTQPLFLSALQPIEMHDVDPRQQYNFYPYLSVTHDGVEHDTEIRAGADLFWRPSSNFQLNATLNPDFGAVESDDVVINLTGTETFFPDKRLFFVEGQEIFTATPRARTRRRATVDDLPVTLVNTRRIGGQPEDPVGFDDEEIEERDLLQPVDLIGAAKATGQFGAFRYGVIGAFEDDVQFRVTEGDAAPAVVEQGGNDYGVARLLWENNDDGRYRALGFLATTVRKDVPGSADAASIDWHYFTRNAKLQIEGQALTSDIEGTGRGYGGFVDFNYTHRQGVRTRLGLDYFDDTVDINDLGFLGRNDYWQVLAKHTRQSSSLAWARNNEFNTQLELRHNLDGYMVQTRLFANNEVTFDSLHKFRVFVGYRPDQYEDLNSFGNGTYRRESALGGGLRFESDESRQLAFNALVSRRGEELGGHLWEFGGGVDWRPSDRFKLGVRVNYLDRDGWLLHTGGRTMATFQAEQVGPQLDGEYFISARQQVRMTLQWVGIKALEDRSYLIPEQPGDLIEVQEPAGDPEDFSISNLNFQVRYRWEIAPLSDLFVVYTRLADQTQALLDEDFGDLFDSAWNDPIADLFIVKLRYRFGS